jgi:hypothetical protein
MEERNAEVPFEHTDLLAQRWLRDVKASCGSTEVTLFRHGLRSSEGAGAPRSNDTAFVSFDACRKYWTARPGGAYDRLCPS